MKKALLSVFVLAFAVALWLVLKRPTRTGDERASLSPTAVTNGEGARLSPLPVSNPPSLSVNSTGFLSKQNRSRLSTEERLRWLETYGQVPADADHIDWQLASQTSWWGKRLDPSEFWRGRTIWLDNSANAAARKAGRAYPPMPYDAPELSDRPHDKDVDLSRRWEVEGPNLRFRYTERESVFWNRFVQSHPRPPEELENRQFKIAEEIFISRRYESRVRRRMEPATDRDHKRVSS